MLSNFPSRSERPLFSAVRPLAVSWPALFFECLSCTSYFLLNSLIVLSSKVRSILLHRCSSEILCRIFSYLKDLLAFVFLYFPRVLSVLVEFVRSSRAEVFFKKGDLRNLAKFTGKHLCQSRFLNIVAGLRRTTLLKKKLWHRCFPVNFAKCLRTPFFIEHLWWLLLICDELLKDLSKVNRT